MMDPRQRLAAAAALALAAVLVFFASLPASARIFGDEESPWPDTEQFKPNLEAVEVVVPELELEVELMESSVARYADWETCLHGVPVSEYGDPDNQFGYDFDERDGTGPGFMPALAVDRTSEPRKEDYLFLDFVRGGECKSNELKPAGTAEEASVHSSPHRGPAFVHGRTIRAPKRVRHLGRQGTLRELERRVNLLEKASSRLDTSSERFDEWESCVSWVPVTQYGDGDGKFGYLYGTATTALGYLPALAIDRSEWEDPEYEFLALVGGDRPGRTCQDEPGEAVD
jgi:hypothetical protein